MVGVGAGGVVLGDVRREGDVPHSLSGGPARSGHGSGTPLLSAPRLRSRLQQRATAPRTSQRGVRGPLARRWMSGQRSEGSRSRLPRPRRNRTASVLGGSGSAEEEYQHRPLSPVRTGGRCRRSVDKGGERLSQTAGLSERLTVTGVPRSVAAQVTAVASIRAMRGERSAAALTRHGQSDSGASSQRGQESGGRFGDLLLLEERASDARSAHGGGVAGVTVASVDVPSHRRRGPVL